MYSHTVQQEENMSINPLDAFDGSTSHEEADPDLTHFRKMEADPELQLLSKRERTLVIHLELLQMENHHSSFLTFPLEKGQTLDSVKTHISEIAIKHGFNVEVWDDGEAVPVKVA
jgi:hypothetical protein